MQRNKINKNPDTFYIIQSFLSTLDRANLTVTCPSLHASVEQNNVPDTKLIPLMQRAGAINRSFGINRILADYTPSYLFSAGYTVAAKNIVLTAALNAPLGHTFHETFGNFCGDTMSGLFSTIVGIPVGIASGLFSYFAFDGGNNYFHANVATAALVGALSSGIAGSNNTAAVSEVISSISPVTAVGSTAALILLAFGLYKNKASVKQKREERDTIHKLLKKY